MFGGGTHASDEEDRHDLNSDPGSTTFVLPIPLLRLPPRPALAAAAAAAAVVLSTS